MKSQIQFDELHTLLRSHNFSNDSLTGSFEKLANAICADVSVFRVGFWIQNGDSFENLISVDQTSQRSRLQPIHKLAAPKFFRSLKEKPQFAVNAIHINEFKEELADLFFHNYEIKAFAGVQIYLKGKVIGFLLVEHKDHRVWKQPEVLYLLIASNHLGHLYSLHLQEKKRQADQSTKLFEENSLPVFICDLKTKRILGVNPQAEIQYGFREQELINQDFWSLGPIHEIIKDSRNTNQFFKGSHLTKAGREFHVKIAAFATQHLGKKVWACIVIDQQDEMSLSDRNEELYNRLADHAFFTSHNIRGPLANILGLIDLIPHTWDDKKNYEEIIYRLKIQAVVLEETIRVMAAKVEVD